MSEWKRVTRAHPCPTCGKPDWCLYSADGTVVICARVESAKRCGDAGWLHRLKDDMARLQRRHVRVVRFGADPSTRPDLWQLAAQYQQDLDHGRLYQLAVSLGLSVTALSQLGTGWSAQHRAWSFPMVNAERDVVGIRLRRPDGYKFAVKGSKEGLFLPATVKEEASPLLIAEGPTDTAALWDMGFRNVVGRPSCTGGIKLLVELVRRQPRDVVIVADADPPGRRGAHNLASVLAVYALAVRVIIPPDPFKDARAWLRGDGKRMDVEQAIAAAPVRLLAVQATTLHGYQE
jgi:hypothetical protein